MAIDPDTYREILTNFPSGVAVVTARDGDGRNYGLTVSAFCAVSLEPPLVLVCIDKASTTLPAMREAGGFTVNLLASGAEELALRFATKSGDKFAGLDWEDPPIPQGGPILAQDSVGYAVCTNYSETEAGDHWIFVGSVAAGEVHAHETPLVYGRRQFAAWDDVG